MSIADNSYFAYNQNDYIDLDTALAEEETASLSYSSHNNDYNRTFRLSFKNYDDNAVQNLRQSLITPLSVSGQDDPMYKSMESNPWRPPPAYSPRVYNEPSMRARIAMSPTHSVADSLAHYNKIIEDSAEVDLVQSDLKDFMGSYSINEIMSHPEYLTPSPQDDPYYRHLSKNTTHKQMNTTEDRPRYRNSLLFELASKHTQTPQKEDVVTTHPIDATSFSSSNEIKEKKDTPGTYRSVKQHVNNTSLIPRPSFV